MLLRQNVTGFFILAGLVNVPFVYNVKTIRDGRSYCTRIVNVTQAEGKGICFTCTCSFKREEESPLDVQEKIDLWEKYAVVLKGTKEEDWKEAPGMDVSWYVPAKVHQSVSLTFLGTASGSARLAAMIPSQVSRHEKSRWNLSTILSLPLTADNCTSTALLVLFLPTRTCTPVRIYTPAIATRSS